jgi:tetratricopeptide (TPR) repeat protein
LFDDIEAFPPGLVWSYMQQNDRPRAEKMLAIGESMDMHGRDPGVYRARGWMNVVDGDLNAARKNFEAGMQVGYRHHSLRYALAAVEYMSGNLDASEAWIRQATEKGAQHVSATRFLARIESARGNWANARALAEQSVAMDSTRVSQELLSWVLVAGDLDVDRGIAMAQRACSMPQRFTDLERRLPYRENAEHTLGLAYLKKGSNRQAVEHLRKAAAEQPNRQALQGHLQRALELSADTE